MLQSSQVSEYFEICQPLTAEWELLVKANDTDKNKNPKLRVCAENLTREKCPKMMNFIASVRSRT